VRPFLVPVTLLLLAGVLWSQRWPFHSPVVVPPAAPAWASDPATVRHPTLRPDLKLASYTYRCSTCHNLFGPPPDSAPTARSPHGIVLKHGINARCLNCHHPTNRDAFVDDWGREIPYNEPYRVCAKCHGPVYRDWLHGAHGRTNGYWNTEMGPRERRRCVECHDPHQPPFPPMRVAPPPLTLRMGKQATQMERPEVRNPLQIYRQPAGERAAAERASGSVAPESETGKVK